MRRRDISKSTILGVAMAAVIPAVSRAKNAHHNENVVFTEDNPGHWAAVTGLHVPKVTVSGRALTIETPHPMDESHYIVSHTVVLANGRFLDRKTFTPQDRPISEHTLPTNYTGQVTITSTCNRHDWWVTSISV
jgi:superoxide reductase